MCSEKELVAVMVPRQVVTLPNSVWLSSSRALLVRTRCCAGAILVRAQKKMRDVDGGVSV